MSTNQKALIAAGVMGLLALGSLVMPRKTPPAPPIVTTGQVIKLTKTVLVGDGRDSLVRAAQLDEAKDMAGIEAMRLADKIEFPRAGVHARVITTTPELTELKIISGPLAGRYAHIWTTTLKGSEPGDPDEERKAAEEEAQFKKDVDTAEKLHRAIASEVRDITELAVFATDLPDQQERTVGVTISKNGGPYLHTRLRQILELSEASINAASRGAKNKKLTMAVHTSDGRFGKYVVGPAIALPPYHTDFLKWQE